MNILVINCGSSTVKFKLIDVVRECALEAGCIDRIGAETSAARLTVADGAEESVAAPVPDHDEAVRLIVDNLGLQGGREAVRTVAAVGHRVVHGADVFSDSVLITDLVIEQIQRCVPLAPLHNPHNLSGIVACRRLMPQLPQVAVFDTAFHAGLPSLAATYAIPRRLAEAHRIKRYGFHGTSHRYVSERTAFLMGRPKRAFRVITCHLGNGASITAVNDGRSVDTSMGMTPLEGLVMGTRCGDIDPSIPFYLIRTAGFGVEEAERILNRESGLAGLSGGWTDMRDLLRLQEQGDDRARLAIEIYAYRVRKYIGAYAAVLGGTDAIAFTGGIGENAPLIRTLACSGLEYMGVSLDEEMNRRCVGREARLSRDRSPVEVWVIPTNEELIIARETARLCQ